MKCNIVKDLLPLYAEGLCSSETAEEIREHLEGCPDCSKLAECDLSAGKVPEPDKAAAMKKVNRSFRKKKLIIRILSGILAAILLVTGVLTVGQIAQEPYLPSFETIIAKHYAKRIVDSITNGYYDGAVLELSYDYLENVTPDGKASDQYFDTINKNDAEALKKAWENAYGNTKVKDYKLKTFYDGIITGTEQVVMSQADIEFEDGRTQQLFIAKNIDGLYKVFIGKADTDEEKKLSDVLLYISLRNIWNTSCWLENALVRDKALDTNKNIMESYFISDGVTDRMDDLYSSGCRITNSVFSGVCSDTEGERFYYKVSITAEDDKGSAVLNTRLYFDENGIYSPAPDDCTVIADGCGKDLEEKLLCFFG